jgi:hypothetical protein
MSYARSAAGAARNEVKMKVPTTVMALLLLGTSGARAARTFSGDYNDTSIRVVLLDIARSARISAVLPPDLEGNVSAHFESMPIDKAVAYLSRLADADYRLTDDTLTVSKRATVARPAAPQMTEREVERAASAIDAENANRRRASRPPRRTQTVRVETSTYIQNNYRVEQRPAYVPFVPYAAAWSGPRIVTFPSGVYTARPYGWGASYW